MILHPENLTTESFRKLGEFKNLYTAGDEYAGNKVEEGFFPDLLRLNNNGNDVSVSITRVFGKKKEISTAELHTNCCEGLLPLDGDVYIYAAPAFWFLKFEETKLFYVPKGTLVKLKAGVIHGSPISVTGEPVNVLILLPERTYANDCKFMELKESQQMQIEE